MKTKLDEAITDQAYILDSLVTLREIYRSGCCNDCANLDCKYRPKAGELVRYNCPFYKVKICKKMED
jgi:hypothetical protein